jgi:hypothetical protein
LTHSTSVERNFQKYFANDEKIFFRKIAELKKCLPLRRKSELKKQTNNKLLKR